MTTAATPYIVFLGFLFGSTLVVSRFSVGQFDSMTYVGLRLLLASVGYLAFYLPRLFSATAGRAWPYGRRLWQHSVVLGVIGTALPMTAIVMSLNYQSSGVTSVLITAGPAVTVVMAHFALADERLTGRKILGVLLALAGALVLTLRGETGLSDIGPANPLGYALVSLAMICGSVTTVYARKYMRHFPAVQVASARMWVAAAIVMPLSLLLVGLDLSNVNATGWAALLYAAAAGTFGGLLLGFYNVKRFGATAAAMTAYFIPIFATAGGALFLDETVTLGMLAGAALIVAGVALLGRRASPQPRLM